SSGRNVGFTVFRLILTIISTAFVFYYFWDLKKAKQPEHLFEFTFYLGIGAINIIITGLLWAGAVGEKRSCLPLFLILELPFCAGAFIRLCYIYPEMSYLPALLLFFFISYCIYGGRSILPLPQG
ncbi:hypothetical protein PMAYCL1PPCAC_05638, partial [Pristionchus mayeri]